MPSSKVMHEFAKKNLHSGSSSGPIVKDRKQAIAIMLSERRDEQAEEVARKRLKPSRKSR